MIRRLQLIIQILSTIWSISMAASNPVVGQPRFISAGDFISCPAIFELTNTINFSLDIYHNHEQYLTVRIPDYSIWSLMEPLFGFNWKLNLAAAIHFFFQDKEVYEHDLKTASIIGRLDYNLLFLFLSFGCTDYSMVQKIHPNTSVSLCFESGEQLFQLLFNKLKGFLHSISLFNKMFDRIFFFGFCQIISKANALNLLYFYRNFQRWTLEDKEHNTLYYNEKYPIDLFVMQFVSDKECNRCVKELQKLSGHKIEDLNQKEMNRIILYLTKEMPIVLPKITMDVVQLRNFDYRAHWQPDIKAFLFVENIIRIFSNIDGHVPILTFSHVTNIKDLQITIRKTLEKIHISIKGNIENDSDEKLIEFGQLLFKETFIIPFKCLKPASPFINFYNPHYWKFKFVFQNHNNNDYIDWQQSLTTLDFWHTFGRSPLNMPTDNQNFLTKIFWALAVYYDQLKFPDLREDSKINFLHINEDINEWIIKFYQKLQELSDKIFQNLQLNVEIVAQDKLKTMGEALLNIYFDPLNEAAPIPIYLLRRDQIGKNTSRIIKNEMKIPIAKSGYSMTMFTSLIDKVFDDQSERWIRDTRLFKLSLYNYLIDVVVESRTYLPYLIQRSCVKYNVFTPQSLPLPTSITTIIAALCTVFRVLEISNGANEIFMYDAKEIHTRFFPSCREIELFTIRFNIPNIFKLIEKMTKIQNKNQVAKGNCRFKISFWESVEKWIKMFVYPQLIPNGSTSFFFHLIDNVLKQIYGLDFSEFKCEYVILRIFDDHPEIIEQLLILLSRFDQFQKQSISDTSTSKWNCYFPDLKALETFAVSQLSEIRVIIKKFNPSHSSFKRFHMILSEMNRHNDKKNFRQSTLVESPISITVFIVTIFETRLFNSVIPGIFEIYLRFISVAAYFNLSQRNQSFLIRNISLGIQQIIPTDSVKNLFKYFGLKFSFDRDFDNSITLLGNHSVRTEFDCDMLYIQLQRAVDLIFLICYSVEHFGNGITIIDVIWTLCNGSKQNDYDLLTFRVGLLANLYSISIFINYNIRQQIKNNNNFDANFDNEIEKFFKNEGRHLIELIMIDGKAMKVQVESDYLLDLFVKVPKIYEKHPGNELRNIMKREYNFNFDPLSHNLRLCKFYNDNAERLKKFDLNTEGNIQKFLASKTVYFLKSKEIYSHDDSNVLNKDSMSPGYINDAFNDDI